MAAVESRMDQVKSCTRVPPKLAATSRLASTLPASSPTRGVPAASVRAKVAGNRPSRAAAQSPAFGFYYRYRKLKRSVAKLARYALSLWWDEPPRRGLFRFCADDFPR